MPSETETTSAAPPPSLHTSNPWKTHLISALVDERREAAEDGGIRNRNPLDESEPFQRLCDACRRGDVKAVQSLISFEKVNVNAVDRFDYPPLTLASLCGHYEVVRLLLENGSVCERDTFQGERCLYSALNNRIRNLLLRYDYSKASDPLQPWAAGVSSLLARAPLDSADITVLAFYGGSAMLSEFRLHKFLLAARSPYFRRKFKEARPEKEKHRPIRTVRLADNVDSRAFETAVKFMYLGEVTDAGDEEVTMNIERLSRHLEIPELWDLVMIAGDQKQRRAARIEAVEKAQEEMDAWFREVVLPGKIVVDNPEEVEKLRVEQNNDSFADLVLAAEDDPDEVEDVDRAANGVVRRGPRTVLYPVHKGMLRSEFFTTMLTSPFKEGRRPGEHEALPVVPIDASPPILELVLSFLYSEKTEIPLVHALDLLFAAEQLLIDRLKLKCSHVICTANSDDLPYSIYEVVRAGWLCRIRRLEEFGAKYIAERLEHYLDDPELAELVAESAERIKERQETDTIELVDDIRYFLGVRFTQRIGKEDALFEGEDAATEEGLALEIGWEGDDEELGLDPLLERRERKLEGLLKRIDLLLDNLRLEA